MFISFLTLVRSANYAVLFAGSKGWGNYRHQADIFTLYQILIHRNFDPSKITIFAYNDIVNNSNNLFPGQVFHSNLHNNVYPGDLAIQYKGEEVSGKNLYEFLLNMNTGKDDNIFIYYDDHGGPEFICDPNDENIYSWKLLQVFKEMHNKEMFNKLFMGIEACFSGSFSARMNIPDVVMMTAAKGDESSLAALPSDTTQPLLSNEFTNFFFNQIDKDQSIKEAFTSIKNSMVGSTPTIAGTEEDQNLMISTFIGQPQPKTFIRKLKSFIYDHLFSSFNFDDITKPEQQKTIRKEMIDIKSKMLKSQRFVSNLVLRVAGQDKSDMYMKGQYINHNSDEIECYDAVINALKGKIGVVNEIGGSILVPIRALCQDYDSKTIISLIN